MKSEFMLPEVAVLSFAEAFNVIPDTNTKVPRKNYLENGSYPVVDQGKEIIGGYSNSKPTVTRSHLPVIVFGDHTRNLKYIDFEFCAGADGTQILSPKKGIEPKFAFHLISQHVSSISSKGYSRHFSDLKKRNFKFPPLLEQKAIVKKLDAAFIEIDLLEENLEATDERTNQLLQSILSASFTPSNIDSRQESPATNQENLRDGQFKSNSIEMLCNVEYGTRVVRKKDAGTIYPVYGGGGETFFLNTYNRENRVVVARFAMSEKCTRRVSGKFALNDSGLTLSVKNAAELRQDYLDFFVLGMNSQIYSSARGTAQKNLDVPAFRQMEISYPASLEKQQEIVEKLNNAFTEIESLRNQILKKKISVSNLRQSILSSAFIEKGEVD